MTLSNINGSINALSNVFLAKFGKKPNANELMDYAKISSHRGVSIFNTWDKMYDGDNIKGNSISSQRHYSNDDNLLFQTEKKDIVGMNFSTKNIFQMKNEEFTEGLMPGTSSMYKSILGDNSISLVQFGLPPTNEKPKV